MNTLQNLLTILGSQKLTAGYLPTYGNGTAHDTVRGLKQQFDPYTLLGSPLPKHTPLMLPAWIGSLGVGQDAIFLDGLDGYLDFSHSPKPAYTFTQPV